MMTNTLIKPTLTRLYKPVTLHKLCDNKEESTIRDANASIVHLKPISLQKQQSDGGLGPERVDYPTEE